MDDDLSDALFEGLPSDPYAASVELLRRVNDHFIDDRSHSNSEAQYSIANGIFAAFYEANHFQMPNPVGFKSGNGVEDLIEWHRSQPQRQYEAFRNQIMEFHALYMRSVAKRAISLKITKAFGYAVLTSEEKEKIHSHLSRVRKIIERSQLDDRKKNSLFDSLSKLERDVDRNGTPTDRFFAFMGDMGFCLGELAHSAGPAIKEVKEILKIITQARARNEQVQLPPSGEILTLPEPPTSEESI
jgi:hypothetical protein